MLDSGVLQLAEHTAAEIVTLAKDNHDPKNPRLFKLRFVGSYLMRVPTATLCSGAIAESYAAARALDYKGVMDEWAEVLKQIFQESYPEWW